MAIANVDPLIAILVLAAWGSPVHAGETKKPRKKSPPVQAEKQAVEKAESKAKSPVADKKTTALLDKAEAQAYLLGKEGAKRASCIVEATVKIQGKEPLKVGFRYEWDGTAQPPKGKITVDPGDEGWKKYLLTEALDGFFWVYSWREEYAGCRLAAKEDGKAEIRIVEGKSILGITTLRLNAAGMPDEITMAIPDEIRIHAPGIPDPKTKVSYVKVNGKFAQSRVTMTLGPATLADSTIEYGKSGKRTVPVKLRASVTPPGEEAWVTEETFDDWRFEDVEKASEPKAGAAKEPEKRKAEKPGKASQ